MKLGEMLVIDGIITREQLEIALNEQKKTRELLGEILVRLNFVDSKTLQEYLAKQIAMLSNEAYQVKKWDKKSKK